MRDPLPIRPENLQRFKDKLNGQDTNRDVQPLGDRHVYLLNEHFCEHYLFEKFKYEADLNFTALNETQMDMNMDMPMMP